MSDFDSKIIEAKRLLRSAGYYCIPREMVLALESRIEVSDLTLRRMVGNGDASGYFDNLLGNISKGFADEIRNLMSVTQTRDPKNFSTNLRATVSLLPADAPMDPFVEEMLKAQRKPRT